MIYPPGVMNSRNIPYGGIYCDAEITELHNGEGFTEGEIRELFGSLDGWHDIMLTVDLREAEKELEWVGAGINWDNSPYHGEFAYHYLDEVEGKMTVDGDIIKKPRVDWETERCLQQFEEDADFEEWLRDVEKVVEEYNFHHLLAWNIEGGANHPLWVGEYTLEETQSLQCSNPRMQAGGPRLFSQVGSLYMKSRYKSMVEITCHPLGDWVNNKKAYSKGKFWFQNNLEGTFGDVYIPYKFLRFLPEVGYHVCMTLALQDVGIGEKKGNSFRWSAIFHHQ